MALCDYCREREAVTKCGVCGSMICQQHDKDYGCQVCDGGTQKF